MRTSDALLGNVVKQTGVTEEQIKAAMEAVRIDHLRSLRLKSTLVRAGGIVATVGGALDIMNKSRKYATEQGSIGRNNFARSLSHARDLALKVAENKAKEDAKGSEDRQKEIEKELYNKIENAIDQRLKEHNKPYENQKSAASYTRMVTRRDVERHGSDRTKPTTSRPVTSKIGSGLGKFARSFRSRGSAAIRVKGLLAYKDADQKDINEAVEKLFKTVRAKNEWSHGVERGRKLIIYGATDGVRRLGGVQTKQSRMTEEHAEQTEKKVRDMAQPDKTSDPEGLKKFNEAVQEALKRRGLISSDRRTGNKVGNMAEPDPKNFEEPVKAMQETSSREDSISSDGQPKNKFHAMTKDDLKSVNELIKARQEKLDRRDLISSERRSAGVSR